MSTFVPKPLPKFYSTSRKLRNEAEKQRRCKLNHHVNQLAALVPFVTKAQKKVDKTSVLRLAASYLRLHNVLSKCHQNQRSFPQSFQGEAAMRTLFNSIGGFFLVITTSGKVVYVSEAIEDTFNYSQTDILGRNFFSLVHQDDIPLIRHHLKPEEGNDRRSFYCRLLKNSSRSYSSSSIFEIIHVMGQLKPMEGSDYAPEGIPVLKDSATDGIETARLSEKLLMKRTSSRASVSYEEADDDEVPSSSQAGARKGPPTDSHILVALVEVVHGRRITEVLWTESLKDEYVTRHKIDGSIAYVDHRISYVTGLMPEEVIGTSAFSFMHQDDILWSLVLHKQMLTSNERQGIATYQLRCRDGQYVMLRSRGYLEQNKDTGIVDSFICINTVVSLTSGESEKKTERKKLMPIFSGKSRDEVGVLIARDLPQEMNMLVEELVQGESGDTFQRILSSLCEDDESARATLPQVGEQPSVEAQLTIPDTSAAAVSEITIEGSSKKRMKNNNNNLSKSPSKYSAINAIKRQHDINVTPSMQTVPNGDPSTFPVELFRSSGISEVERDNLSSYPTCSEIEQLIFTNTTIASSPPIAVSSHMGFAQTFSQSQPSSSYCPENCIDFNAFQPSYSQIENWGYPPVTAELPYTVPVPVPDSIRPPTNSPQNLPLNEPVTSSSAYFDTTSPSNNFSPNPKSLNYFCTQFYKPQPQNPHSSQTPPANHYQNEDRWPSRERFGN